MKIKKYQNPATSLPKFDYRNTEESIGGIRTGLDGKRYFLTPEEIKQYDSISNEERNEMTNSSLYKNIQAEQSQKKKEEEERKKEIDTVRTLAKEKVNAIAHTEWSDFDADSNLKEIEKINKDYKLPSLKYLSKEDAKSLFDSETNSYMTSTGLKTFFLSAAPLAMATSPFLAELGLSIATGKGAQVSADYLTNKISNGRLDQFVDIYGDPDIKRNGEERSNFGKRAVNTARFALSPEMLAGVGTSVGLRKAAMKLLPTETAKNYFSTLENSYRTLQHPVTTILDKATINSTKNSVLKLPGVNLLEKENVDLLTNMAQNNTLWKTAAIEDIARHGAEIKGLNDVSKGKQSGWTLFANPLLPLSTVNSIVATRQGSKLIGLTPGIQATALNNGSFNHTPTSLLKAHSIGSYRGYNYESPWNNYSMDKRTGKVNMGYAYMSKDTPGNPSSAARVQFAGGYWNMPKKGSNIGKDYIYLGTMEDLGMINSIVNEQASNSGLGSVHVITRKSNLNKVDRLGGPNELLDNKNIATTAAGVDEPLIKINKEEPTLILPRGSGKKIEVATSSGKKYLKVNSADNTNAVSIIPIDETTKGVYAVTADLQQGASTVGTWIGNKLGPLKPIVKKLTSGIEGGVLDIQHIRDLGQITTEGNNFKFTPGVYRKNNSGTVEFKEFDPEKGTNFPAIRSSLLNTLTESSQAQLFEKRNLSLAELGVPERKINKVAKELNMSREDFEGMIRLGYIPEDLERKNISREILCKKLGIKPEDLQRSKGLLNSKDWGSNSGLINSEGESPVEAISKSLNAELKKDPNRNFTTAIHEDDPDWTYVSPDNLTGDISEDSNIISNTIKYKKALRKLSKRDRSLINYYQNKKTNKIEANLEF